MSKHVVYKFRKKKKHGACFSISQGISAILNEDTKFFPCEVAAISKMDLIVSGRVHVQEHTPAKISSGP